MAGPSLQSWYKLRWAGACHLADLAGPDGWSTAAAEDVLAAIDTLTDTHGGAGEELAQALAAVATATAQARRRLGITVDDQAPGRDMAARRPWRVARGESPPDVAGSVRASGASVRTTENARQERVLMYRTPGPHFSMAGAMHH
ncbi:hypothetical protein [Streptomyces coeruleorubidus]|uniref:hypothetical protein n=1 Tax=Streptomyces coeruleorubidus TaxID=116188 RepID=UPI0036BB7897